MHEFNLSLFSKLGWKLLSNSDCLWVNQLKKKYIKYGDFISSPISSSSSWIWFFRPLPKFPSNRNFLALQIRDLIDHTHLSWKALALNSLFDPISVQEILRTRISTEIVPAYIWTPSTSGKFSLSSVYKFITDSSTNVSSFSIRPQFWNSIWKLNLNDRLKLFLSKIA